MRNERSQTQQIRHSLRTDLTAGKPQRQTSECVPRVGKGTDRKEA